MTICSYDFQYEDEIITLWNKTLKFDPINRHIFRERVLFDKNFDKNLFLLIKLNNNIVGFLYGVCRKSPYGTRGTEEHRSFLVAKGIDPAHQKKGFGSQLITEFERRVNSRPLITVGAYSPKYFFPGLDHRYQHAQGFFKKHGFTIGEQCVSMDKVLHNFEIPANILTLEEKARQQGYVFDKYCNDDLYDVIHFLENEFPGGWIENFMALINDETATKRVFIVRFNNKVVGFVQRALDGNDSHFGPFGVSSEHQGIGLGKILFYKMLYDMYCSQYYYVWFAWADTNAKKFYDRVGMNIYRTFNVCYKQRETNT